jgi:hypothetical protein
MKGSLEYSFKQLSTCPRSYLYRQTTYRRQSRRSSAFCHFLLFSKKYLLHFSDAAGA